MSSTKIFLRTLNGVPDFIEVIDENISNKYEFQEVTPKQLAQLRLSKKPGLVYKCSNRLYYAAIPGTIRITGSDSNLGVHLCGQNCTKVCKGCPKTYDLTVAYQERCGKSFFEAVKASWRVEKYRFIAEGIEAFNMVGSNDAFVVTCCDEFEERPPRKPTTGKPGKKAILDLANYIWPDFDGSYEELRLRINSAKSTPYKPPL